MSQEEINQKEWENQNNWHGLKWLSVYCSKKDTRIFVPKQIPWMGLGLKKATPNFGHPLGALSFILVIAILFAIGIFVFKASKG